MGALAERIEGPAESFSHHAPQGDVPSLLKWTGSKRSQAAHIARFTPAHERYFEPFLGGGALLFHFARHGAQASDIYAPLIEFWKRTRDAPHALVKNYAAQWQSLQKDLPGYFYTVRERFNKEPNPEDLNFLMRTCVNGIARFSKGGQFNNSFHLSRRGMMPDRFAAVVRKWTARLQGVDFHIRDYAEAFAQMKRGDFAYLDPPYFASRHRYVHNLDFARFCAELEKLNRRGVKWALSFDGSRGEKDYKAALPGGLYKNVFHVGSGHSAVSKVLNGPIERVTESLYLNYY